MYVDRERETIISMPNRVSTGLLTTLRKQCAKNRKDRAVTSDVSQKQATQQVIMFSTTILNYLNKILDCALCVRNFPLLGFVGEFGTRVRGERTGRETRRGKRAGGEESRDSALSERERRA